MGDAWFGPRQSHPHSFLTGREDRLERRGSSSSIRRRLVLEEDDSRREPGVVAKLMGLESFESSAEMIQEEKCSSSSSSSNNRNGEVRQLHELLRIREPFLLRELLRDEECGEWATTSAPSFPKRAPSLREKFAHLVRRKPSVGNMNSSRQKSDVIVVLSPRGKNVMVNRGVSPIKSPCKKKRGLMLESAVKILPSSASSTYTCSSSSSTSTSPAEDTSSSSSSSSSDEETMIHMNRKKKLGRSSSEPTLQVGNKRGGGLAKLSENLTRRFVHGKTSSDSTETEVPKKRMGFGRSKSDLGLAGGPGPSSNKQEHSLKERVKNMFNSGRKKQVNVINVGSTTSSSGSTSSNSSLLKSLWWGKQRKQKIHRGINSPTLQRQEEHQQQQKHQVAKKLQFSDEVNERSPSGCTTSGQPSPVSVLDEIYTTPESTSGGETSPDGKADYELETTSRGCDVHSDNIISAILDISRSRNIDLSSIGIARHSDRQQEQAYIEEIILTSERQCEGDWYTLGLPILDELLLVQSLESRKLLLHCLDDALEARFSSLRHAARWPWLCLSPQVRPGPKILAVNAYTQICDWRSMAVLSTDEVIERDMRIGSGKWSDWEEQVDSVASDTAALLLDSMLLDLAFELAEYSYTR